MIEICFWPLFAVRQSVPLSTGLDVEQIEAKDGTRCDQVEFLSNTHRQNGALRN